MASCAAACDDDAFLTGNALFCAQTLGTRLGDATALRDDASCPAAGSEARPRPDGEALAEGEVGPEPVATGPEAPDECAALDLPSERIRCERSRDQNRPTCSQSVVLLEQDADLLTAEVQAELAGFGDLLERDLSDVSSRNLLCALPLAELDLFFIRATDDPQSMRSIQRHAQDIQSCQLAWEDYIRAERTEGLSDVLADDVARDMETQFRPMRDELENLSASINTLERAATTIEGLISMHIDFCDPAGTPIAEE